MDLTLPAPVQDALARLEAAGYEAYVVGGAVREALRGGDTHDWDLTTSALPAQTEAVFAGERVIETGIKNAAYIEVINGLSEGEEVIIK